MTFSFNSVLYKECKSCGVSKKIENFYVGRKGKRSNICKQCAGERKQFSHKHAGKSV